jgi:hypothetical protein
MPAQGRAACLSLFLVASYHRESFVYMVVRAIDVRKHATLQTPRRGIVFFLGHVTMSLVQQFAGVMQTSGPGLVRVNVNVIVDVLAVIDGGLLDFIDGVVDIINCSALFGMQRSAIGALQKTSGVPQVGKSVQVSGMLGLCTGVLGCERDQESNRCGKQCNSKECLHSGYHLG